MMGCLGDIFVGWIFFLKFIIKVLNIEVVLKFEYYFFHLKIVKIAVCCI